MTEQIVRLQAAAPLPAQDVHPRSTLSTAVAVILTLVVPVILWFAPIDVEPHAQKALAVASFMIGAWITHSMDPVSYTHLTLPTIYSV